MSASQVSLKIVIVGAGLAGLAAAIACARVGHTVTVIEAVKELSEVRRPQVEEERAISSYTLKKIGRMITFTATRRIVQQSDCANR